MSTEARSRIEAILGNMLGGDYIIEEPMSRNEELLLALSDQWAGFVNAATTPITDAQIDAALDTL